MSTTNKIDSFTVLVDAAPPGAPVRVNALVSREDLELVASLAIALWRGSRVTDDGNHHRVSSYLMGELGMALSNSGLLDIY